jgi:aminopeptidase N
MKKGLLFIISCLLFPILSEAQLMGEKNVFTRADTLRGSITKFRNGWDVVRYDLTVQPDFITKTITGKNVITYNETEPVVTMQIDLQQPLVVDSITGQDNNSYSFRRDGNVCFVSIRDSTAKYKFAAGIRTITVYYHGQPKEAKRAPWDGGLVWKTDVTGNPFIATACQGLGASVWWPCKDHQSDEPDSGMTINIIAPEGVSAVSNGRLKDTSPAINGMKKWTWEVKNPINNYDVTMNVGKYTNWTDTMMGEDGKLDLEYWVLDYNLDKAKKQFEQVKPMLHSHEYWFGKYPFYEDGYKLVETPFLGMEHQSAVAYGNDYANGYRGTDLSGSGWGLKWDFIIIHESGHEWFGNNITSQDLADMWLHESFTNYSETLYTETMFGKQAANEYCIGTRKNIKNDKTIIGIYGVNKEGSGDMYYKGGNMLQTIRHVINDDEKFRRILRGLNAVFYHQQVTTKQVEEYISVQSGTDLSKVFDQYLRTVQVPVLEYYFSKNKQKVFYRWSNCLSGFNMPLTFETAKGSVSITPNNQWKSTVALKKQATLWNAEEIEKKYYIVAKNVEGKK